MLRSNLSARSMPEGGQEYVLYDMLLPSRSSFGPEQMVLWILSEFWRNCLAGAVVNLVL